MSQQVDFARDLATVSLTERMQGAYLDYAMSVIVGRALPDVRDGLKPVHRRILYAMHEAGNDWNKPFKKSARIVGDVLGKYHPHGGEAVYDALVRMAQPFSMRLPLVDGQGNFGSIDGDNPAAMRYTEVRMARAAHALLEDIDKDTVDFAPNYDGAETEPVVLPARFPALLVNGGAGIAVGMATNIPPHNLGEVIDACLLLLKNPDATIDDLIKKMPAPDFPTGGFIHGVAGARAAYQTGNGRVVMRARTHFEELDKGNRTAIIIDELPYQVNKSTLIERIADLSRDKKLEGISDLRDESDREGIRVVIELRRGQNAEVTLNRLYKETQMQDNFSVNMVALADGVPRSMNLREILRHFLDHRREVVVKRALFDLEKARARAHLLEGYAVAVANMDEVVDLIKKSPSPAAAEEQLLAKVWKAQAVADMLSKLEDPTLMRPSNAEAGRGVLCADEKGGAKKLTHYRLSSAQAKAILELRLSRLTAMEREKILADYAEIVGKIAELLSLLSDPEKIKAVIQSELELARKMFATPRRSEIVEDASDIDIESLIVEEEMAVTFSNSGYVKRQPISDYRAQRRGGRGKQAAGTRENDFIKNLFVASTHDYLLIFTNRGRVYWKKVYELPLASRISRGRPIVNLLPLAEHEHVHTVLAVREFDDKRSVVFGTAKGTVKRTVLSAYSKPRNSGIIAITLEEGDSLINAALTNDDDSLIMFSDAGKAAHFQSGKVRATGRSARGVRGMRLKEDQKVVALLALTPQEAKDKAILVAAEKGRGKRTAAGEFPIKGRGGQGVLALKVNDKNGKVVGAAVAGEGDELMLITDAGVMVRTAMDKIRQMGRNTQGVSLIRLDEGSRLSSVASIEADENGQGEDGAA